MKKFLALTIIAALGFTSMTGCVDDRPPVSVTPVADVPAPAPAAPVADVPAPAPAAPAPAAPVAPAPAAEAPTDEAEAPVDDAPAAASGAIKTGLGIVTSVASSVPGSAVQVDSTMAAITIDENNVITKLSIDAAQTRIAIDAAGNVTGDLAGPFPSKKEKLDAYNMRGASGIGKEWYEQAEGFENWAIGKTVDEVVNLATVARDDAHPAVPTDPDLAASVTISVGEFKEAVAKAVTNAKAATVEGDYQTGLGIVTTATGGAGTVTITSDTVALTTDANGVIVAATLDAGYTTVKFDATGAFTTDMTALVPSKLELGDAYNMVTYGGAIGEWYAQADGLCAWAMGKTVAEVTGMPLDAASGKPTDADVVATTTISVTDILSTFVSAGNNLK